jgi:transcriptional regulator with XRE-family HTH domain
VAVRFAGMGYSAAEIIAARQRARLTQEQLAERLGMTDTRSIIRWEREGITDRGHYLGRIEEVLGLGNTPTQLAPDTTTPDEDQLLAQVSEAKFWLEAARRALRNADITPDESPRDTPTLNQPKRGRRAPLPEHLLAEQSGERRKLDHQ